MHRTTLGDFELTIVSDGTYFLDGGAFFGVVPKTMWSKKVSPDELNRLDAGLNSLLIRTGEKNILVETGIGNKLPDKLAQIYKQPAKLLDNLHAAGVAPEDIDIVINTHLHFDHCGWNTVRRGDTFVATFPKAKYYAQRREWEHGRLQLERDAVSYMSPNYDPLIETGQMILLDGDCEITPGVSVKIFPGHTANMQAVIVTSGAKAPAEYEASIATQEQSTSLTGSSEQEREKEATGGPSLPRSLRQGWEDSPGHEAALAAEKSLEGVRLQSLRKPPLLEELGKGTALALPSGGENSRASAPEETADAARPRTACYISDLIPTSHHLDLTWVMAFDLDPLQTIESRKRYYSQAIPERWLTVFTHDDQTPWGFAERGERGKLTLARM